MKLGSRPRLRTAVAGVVMSALVALLVALGAGEDADAGITPASSVVSTSEDTTAASDAEAAAPTFDDDAVDAALEALGGQVSLAAVNLDTGVGYASDDTTYDTASIVKVDILATLLLQQDGTMTAAQQALATTMIEQSDNAAATSLFEAAGGAEGLTAANEVFGLTSTRIGSSGLWGLTQTTVADQTRLLEVVFGDDSVLSSEAQDVMADLMSNVIDSQHFGVSAAADDPEDAALKVGYLQRSATGLWDVTSIGRVEIDGETWVVAVLSEDNTSFAAGQQLVESAAELVRLGAGAA